MSGIMDVWKEFHEKGTITRAEADRRMKEIVAKDEKKVKHIPGRYNSVPFWCINIDKAPVHIPDENLLAKSRLYGDCCETKEETESILNQKTSYLTLIYKIYELNDGWFPDWANDAQLKYSLSYDHFRNKIDIDSGCNYQYLKNELYFKSGEISQAIVKELGEEIIKLALWGIEQ